MTVKEMIEHLQDLDPELLVYRDCGDFTSYYPVKIVTVSAAIHRPGSDLVDLCYHDDGENQEEVAVIE